MMTNVFLNKIVSKIAERIIVRTVSIGDNDFAYFKTDGFIHEQYVSRPFTKELELNDYAVHDGTKVIGYTICGYFFDYTKLY